MSTFKTKVRIKKPIFLLKFIYSEKAKIFCKISTFDLSYVVPVKSAVEISQNFVTFSEYTNFNNFFLPFYVFFLFNIFFSLIF